MKTPPDKRIVFTFYSHPMKDLRQRWKATLAFAPGSTDESAAALDIRDGYGDPIAAGTLSLAGSLVAIRDGRGALRCGDFVRGKHEQGIWLHRKGYDPVPGALTFE